MKKNIIIICFIIAIVGGVSSMMLGGCKNYLEKPAGGTVTVDTIFDTQNQAQYAVASMYNLCVMGYLGTQQHPSQGRPDVITDEDYVLPDVGTEGWSTTAVCAYLYVGGNMAPNYTPDYNFWHDASGILSPGNQNVGTYPYGDHYSGIRQANLVYQNIDQVTDATAAYKQDVKGQALFCRALQHFELFRYYGGIPLVTSPIDPTSGSIAIPRSSVATTVDSIVSWCNQAEALLPVSRSVTDYGKATSLAAMALRARVLLYAASPLYNTPSTMQSLVSGARFGDARDSVLSYPSYDASRWNLAAQAAKAVIDSASIGGIQLYNTGKPSNTEPASQYSDLGDYAHVWNVFGNPEIILCNTATLQGYNWDVMLSSHLISAIPNTPVTNWGNWGIKNNVPVEFMQQYQTASGANWTMPQTGEDLPSYLQGLNLDPRFYQTIAYDGMNYALGYILDYYKGAAGYSDGKLSGSQTSTNCYGWAVEPYKFLGRVNNMDVSQIAWPVFRLAEFYLSYAEALNEAQGPTSDALHYLNLVRERAGMPDYNISDQATFRTAVQRERTIEFAYENLRYNDLLRWLTAGTVLNQTLHVVQTTAAAGAGNPNRSWQIIPVINRVFPQKYYYIPFPNTEVSKNYLGDGKSWNGQNPGY